MEPVAPRPFKQRYDVANIHVEAVMKRVKKLLEKKGVVVLNIRQAPKLMDMQDKVDFVVETPNGDIYVGWRNRPDPKYHKYFHTDWTIHWTELDELINGGKVKYYFYTCQDGENGPIIAWYFLDVDLLRSLMKRGLRGEWVSYPQDGKINLFMAFRYSYSLKDKQTEKYVTYDVFLDKWEKPKP